MEMEATPRPFRWFSKGGKWIPHTAHRIIEAAWYSRRRSQRQLLYPRNMGVGVAFKSIGGLVFEWVCVCVCVPPLRHRFRRVRPLQSAPGRGLFRRFVQASPMGDV